MMPKLSSVSQYLRTIPSKHCRGQIRGALTEILKGKALWVGRHPFTPLNDAKRECLHDGIFRVEDGLESRAGGQPDHPLVVAMNRARNRVMDDLRWNDPPQRLLVSAAAA